MTEETQNTAEETKQQETPTPIETKHFSSDELELNVEIMPNCIVNFHVTVKEPLVKEATKQGIKKVAKDVTLPGFRKGKAPTDIVLKKYPKEVDSKVKHEMANMAYTKSQQLADISVISQEAKISFDVKEFGENEAKLFFSFEAEPIVPEIDPSTLNMEEIQKEEINDEKVENTIKHIQQFYATYDTIEDRGIEEGDFVLLDIEDLDLDPPSKAFSDTRFEVKKKSMADWMLEAILGKKPGESVDTVSKPNEDDSEEVKKEFEPKNVRITVKKIESANLPPVDDELAKKLGVETADEMREQLTKQLNMQAEHEFQQKQRNAISKALIEKYSDFDIPQSLLATEVNHRLKMMSSKPEYMQMLRGKNKEEREQYIEDMKKEAENAIRLFYLSKHIVEKNHIRLSLEEEPRHAPSNMIEAMFQKQQHQPHENMSEEERAALFSRKMLTAAEDYLIEQLKKS